MRYLRNSWRTVSVVFVGLVGMLFISRLSTPLGRSPHIFSL
jgi:hypothetical protein